MARWGARCARRACSLRRYERANARCQTSAATAKAGSSQHLRWTDDLDASDDEDDGSDSDVALEDAYSPPPAASFPLDMFAEPRAVAQPPAAAEEPEDEGVEEAKCEEDAEPSTSPPASPRVSAATRGARRLPRALLRAPAVPPALTRQRSASGAPPPPRALAREASAPAVLPTQARAPLSPAPAASAVAPATLPEVAIDVEDVGVAPHLWLTARLAFARGRGDGAVALVTLDRRGPSARVAPLVGIGNSEAAAIAAAAGEAVSGPRPPPRRRPPAATAAAAAPHPPRAPTCLRPARARSASSHSAPTRASGRPASSPPQSLPRCAARERAALVFTRAERALAGAPPALALELEQRRAIGAPAAPPRSKAAALGAHEAASSAASSPRRPSRARRSPAATGRATSAGAATRNGRPRRRGRAFLLARVPRVPVARALSPGAAAHLAPPATVARLARFAAEAQVGGASAALCWCPRAGCGRAVELSARLPDGRRARAARPAPALAFCECDGGVEPFCALGGCGGAGHWPLDCEDAARYERAKGVLAGVALDRVHSRQHQAVPGCRHRIEKNGGCLHMRCGSAGTPSAGAAAARPRRAAPSSAGSRGRRGGRTPRARMNSARRARPGVRARQPRPSPARGARPRAQGRGRGRGRTARRGGRRPPRGRGRLAACGSRRRRARPPRESARHAPSAVRRALAELETQVAVLEGLAGSSARRVTRAARDDLLAEAMIAMTVAAGDRAAAVERHRPRPTASVCSREGARAPAEAGEVEIAAPRAKAPRPGMHHRELGR